jgi:hypothetical protein
VTGKNTIPCLNLHPETELITLIVVGVNTIFVKTYSNEQNYVELPYNHKKKLFIVKPKLKRIKQ